PDLGRADASGVRYPILPPLGQGYRRLKQQLSETPDDSEHLVELAGETFDSVANCDETVPYVVNPYFDFNGVRLLYFASYPRIDDVCERVVFNARLLRAGRKGATAESAFQVATLARDTYYYGNADAGDVLDVSFRKVERVGRRLKLWSVISRRHDGA